MGLSNFPSAAEGVLPVLVMNTVMSVAILKNLLRSFLELMGASTWVNANFDGNDNSSSELPCNNSYSKRRRARGVSIIKFKSSNFALDDCVVDEGATTRETRGETATTIIECCVCLSKFEEEEEVSELSCKHFFHKNCLDKWFDNHHSTCPLCRSIH